VEEAPRRVNPPLFSTYRGKSRDSAEIPGTIDTTVTRDLAYLFIYVSVEYLLS
jgi:hypothetical protein